jgi:hypothetical protein
MLKWKCPVIAKTVWPDLYFMWLPQTIMTHDPFDPPNHLLVQKAKDFLRWLWQVRFQFNPKNSTALPLTGRMWLKDLETCTFAWVFFQISFKFASNFLRQNLRQIWVKTQVKIHYFNIRGIQSYALMFTSHWLELLSVEENRLFGQWGVSIPIRLKIHLLRQEISNGTKQKSNQPKGPPRFSKVSFERHLKASLEPSLTGLKIQVVTSEVSRQCTVKTCK